MLSIIYQSNKKYENEKLRLIFENFMRRENDQRKKVIVSNQTLLLINPRGFRAPGLQDGKFGARELHRSPPGLYLTRISIYVRTPSK